MEDTRQPDPNFAYFVNDHIEANTKFKWADQLLKKSKPLTVPWACFWIVALAFSVDNIEHGFYAERIIPGIFLGYAAAYLVGRVIYYRLYRKFSTGSFYENITLEDLIAFLNTHLLYLQPFFGQWVRGEGSLSGKDYIGFAFSKRVQATITFSENSAGEKFYAISTMPTSNSGIIMRLITRADVGLGRLICLYKTAPIISAAMKYYLQRDDNV